MNAIKKTLACAALGASALSAAIGVQAGFQVSGTQLLDGNGNPFIMRGVNHPHTWFTGRTEQALSDIASVNANTVRIVLSDGQQWTRNSAADVAQVIEWCKDNELIAVLEVHDATGSGEQDSAGTLENVVDYWLDIAPVLEGQEDYVIINIANEPFGNGVAASTWVDQHVDAIQRLREAGLTHTLLVDAANWGQDWQGVMRDNASTVAAADERNNTLFSVHMYEVYQDRSTIENYVSTFLSTHNLPLIVGEFGADHYGNEVDEASVLSVAEDYGIGYLGWSWSGNSSEVASLDITLNWDVDNLSSWGDFLINSSNGLRQTAQTATVYEGQSSSSSSDASSSSSSSSSSISSSSSSSHSSSSSAQPGAGDCEYQITNEWSSGYTGAIRLTNSGTQPVDGWSVSWEYSDGSRITNSWNAELSGNNPYSAANLDWNGVLQPGQTIEFGFQVNKGGADAQVPSLSGPLCD
ncbi:cellulase family glycosylhydrolase [Marinimicrobium sp. LS-A18]|uniref:cellulase family glycosylhydrolase n=1 Tax=Marinimicrobium sp. LS-A18 TaxID=1381596 RepID=UPI0004B5FF87|nr:cellulase family glycosylhydrolase [Marinimicrobium sp. LS-A18]